MKVVNHPIKTQQKCEGLLFKMSLKMLSPSNEYLQWCCVVASEKTLFFILPSIDAHGLKIHIEGYVMFLCKKKKNRVEWYRNKFQRGHFFVFYFIFINKFNENFLRVSCFISLSSPYVHLYFHPSDTNLSEVFQIRWDFIR